MSSSIQHSWNGVNVPDSLQPCGVTSRLRPPMSVVDNSPLGKATDVSPWYGVYSACSLISFFRASANSSAFSSWTNSCSQDILWLIGSQHRVILDVIACQSPAFSRRIAAELGATSPNGWKIILGAAQAIENQAVFDIYSREMDFCGQNSMSI